MTDDEPLRAYVREAMKCIESREPSGLIPLWLADDIALTAARLASADRDKLMARNAELVGALEEAISAIDDDTGLDETICCSGAMCGCRGSSHRQLLLHTLRQALSTGEA